MGVVDRLHVVPGRWFGSAQGRFIDRRRIGLRGALLLKSRVIARRRRHGRRRGAGWRRPSRATKCRDSGEFSAKSSHLVPPGAGAADGCIATGPETRARSLPFQGGYATRRLQSFEHADIPGRVMNAGLARQAGDDSVEFGRFDRKADQRGHDFGSFAGPVHHVGIPHRLVRSLQFFEQNFSDRCNGARVRGDQHIMACFRGVLVDRDAIDGVDQQTKQRVAAKHEKHQQRRLGDHIRPRAAPDRNRGPQGGCGVEAPDVDFFFHDRTGAEKSDSRAHSGNHANASLGSGEVIGEIDKRRGSDRDKNVGSQPGTSLPVLPLSPDHGSKHECGQKADEHVQEVIQLKRLDEALPPAQLVIWAVRSVALGQAAITNRSSLSDSSDISAFVTRKRVATRSGAHR